jgi:hypothetical protein
MTGRTLIVSASCALVACMMAAGLQAQQPPGRAGGPPQPPPTPRAAAPVDLTGTWVSVITEDWRFRMLTPPRGDFASMNLNAEGTRVGNEWDPQRDIAAGEQCRAYGAIGVMRLPTRLRISWQDDTTLKVEADAGTQTRLFRFRTPGGPVVTAPAGEAPSWQGYSVAAWETQAEGSGVAGGGGGRGGGGAPALSSSLKVVTTNLRPGYHRRNGAPYSGNAVYTEFFDRTSYPNGDSWLIVTSIVDDPQYLQGPFMNSTQFKREPDASKFSPRPCEVTDPVDGERTAPTRGGGAGRGGAPAAPAGRGRGN